MTGLSLPQVTLLKVKKSQVCVCNKSKINGLKTPSDSSWKQKLHKLLLEARNNVTNHAALAIVIKNFLISYIRALCGARFAGYCNEILSGLRSVFSYFLTEIALQFVTKSLAFSTKMSKQIVQRPFLGLYLLL